jgi:hypothetical protein
MTRDLANGSQTRRSPEAVRVMTQGGDSSALSRSTCCVSSRCFAHRASYKIAGGMDRLPQAMASPRRRRPARSSGRESLTRGALSIEPESRGRMERLRRPRGARDPADNAAADRVSTGVAAKERRSVRRRIIRACGILLQSRDRFEPGRSQRIGADGTRGDPGDSA